MELRMHRFRANGAYVSRKNAVHGWRNPLDGYPRRPSEADDLSQGVHTGIRATSARDADMLAGERCDRSFQLILHGALAFLPLEACEVGTIVFDDQLDGLRGDLLRPKIPLLSVGCAASAWGAAATISPSTSSRTAMGAASPRRAPMRVMRQ